MWFSGKAISNRHGFLTSLVFTTSCFRTRMPLGCRRNQFRTDLALPRGSISAFVCICPGAARRGYGKSMTLDAIKEAVVHLSEADREQFAHWFEELADEVWDKQIERDFGPGGSGVHLVEKIDREIDHSIASGNVPTLEDGLRARREQRTKK